jgi:hypothetical protein
MKNYKLKWPPTDRFWLGQTNGDQEYVFDAPLQTWNSPDGRIYNQIDEQFGGQFSDVIDVKAQRSVNIDSNHILVVITLRAKICRTHATRQEQQQRRLVVERLKSKD